MPDHGGAEGIRTPDLLIANQPLSQLSYGPTCPRIIAAGHAKARSCAGQSFPRPNDPCRLNVGL